MPPTDPSPLAEFGLTSREREVLAWITAGKRNTEVGAILAISSRTVGKHLERIYQKLGVETRTAAVRVALDAGRDTSNDVLTEARRLDHRRR